MAGWPRTIVFCLVFLLMLSLMVFELARFNLGSPAIWFLPGLVFGVFLRPVMLAHPPMTLKVINVFWFVYFLHAFVGHKVLGKPHWSECALFALGGLYLTASFVFYSSKLLYVASLVVEAEDDENKQNEAVR